MFDTRISFVNCVFCLILKIFSSVQVTVLNLYRVIIVKLYTNVAV